MEKKYDFIPDPITGRTFEKELHLFNTKKEIHAKDDVKALRNILSQNLENQELLEKKEKVIQTDLEFQQNDAQVLQEVIIFVIQNG